MGVARSQCSIPISNDKSEVPKEVYVLSGAREVPVKNSKPVVKPTRRPQTRSMTRALMERNLNVQSCQPLPCSCCILDTNDTDVLRVEF